MGQYDTIAQFYDDIMGDQEEIAAYISEFIMQRNPNAESLLEVACGTGALMKQLSVYYEVSGLDKSTAMVKIAKDNIPEAKLHQLDMVDFKLNEKFDVIICMNDSINHLLNFSDWKKMFTNISRHLNSGGVFIFDINTEFKLEEISIVPPMVHEFDENILIIDVQKQRARYEWNLRIFKHNSNNKYEMYEETLYEKSFPTKKIKEALSKQFHKIKVHDLDQYKITKNSERLYFVATKK